MCTCETCSYSSNSSYYSSVMLAICHKSLRSVLSPWDGTILHPTCTCGTCSYSSVTLAIHHRSLCLVFFSMRWDPSSSNVYLWDLQLLIQFITEASAQSFLHLTCTCGTCSYSCVTLAFVIRDACNSIREVSRSILFPCDMYLWDPSPSDVYLWDS
jgi:hypothetical protein